MATGSLARAKNPEGDSIGKAAAPFLQENAVMSTYGGLTPRESCHKVKLISRAINSVSMATPEYLR
jgi:hypothetical protein